MERSARIYSRSELVLIVSLRPTLRLRRFCPHSFDSRRFLRSARLAITLHRPCDGVLYLIRAKNSVPRLSSRGPPVTIAQLPRRTREGQREAEFPVLRRKTAPRRPKKKKLEGRSTIFRSYSRVLCNRRPMHLAGQSFMAEPRTRKNVCFNSSPWPPPSTVPPPPDRQCSLATLNYSECQNIL